MATPASPLIRHTHGRDHLSAAHGFWHHNFLAALVGLAALALIALPSGPFGVFELGSAHAQVATEAEPELKDFPEEEAEPLIQIVRIELNGFFGIEGAATYLSLPDILDDTQTFDTAADEILNFSGVSQPDLRAPEKEFESGLVAGGSATFYLGSNFGFQLYGSYAKLDAVLSGITATGAERFEADRASVTVLRGAGNIIYNIGREEKWAIRPYVNLGFGGLLNKFPATDDVTALYFNYGAGASGPIAGNIRWDAGARFTLYSFSTDEVALDETITLPSVYAGLTWRYNVPEDNDAEEVGLGQ